MQALFDMTVKDFVMLTGSDAPAPGGGSVAALAGSLGAALEQMVSELTIGKEKYAEVEADVKRVREEAMKVKEELLEAMDEDSRSFTDYMNALGMPKSTEEEKAERREALQNGLKSAALVPLKVAETAVKLLPLSLELVHKGNANAVTDALVAAMMSRSAVIGAVLNCRINLASIKDEEFVKNAGARADELVKQAIEGERKAFAANELTADCL